MTSTYMLQASNAAELEARLAALDIEVPTRAGGRTKSHGERYSVSHVLATLPIERLLFPLTLTHRERPDFLLSMGDGDVGIEHTEAVPPEVVRADKLREKEGLGPDCFWIRPAIPGDPGNKTDDQLRQEILANEPPEPWVGDSVEREWADAMEFCVTRKTNRATAAGFGRYRSNWLIVYDNWPLPAVDYPQATSYLMPRLTTMNAFAVFDSIFVMNDSQMCEFRYVPTIYALLKPWRKTATV